MHKSLALALAAGFALCGCAKPEVQAEEEGSRLPGDRLDYITAISPGAQVKTLTQDGVKVLWADGDKIGLFGNAEYATRLQEPSARATFGRTSEAEPKQAGGIYLAVYPSAAVSEWTSSPDPDNPEAPFCYVSVPVQQTAVKGSWDKGAAVLVASSPTKDFAFRHAVAYLRFEVTAETGAFASVRLASVHSEKLSDVKAGVRFPGSDAVALTPGSTAADYVVLRCADGSAAFENGTYYVAFLPGDFTEGLTLSFTNADGQVARKGIGALTLKSGDVVDYGPVAALHFEEASVTLQTARVFKENGIDQGVVYWINPDDPSRGKAVSVSSAEMLWSKELIWTAKIESTTDGLANYDQFHGSAVYTDRKDDYYALKYCEDLRERLGGNWYLPAPGELQTLYKAYYGLSVASLSAGVDYRFDGGVLVPGAMETKAAYDAALHLMGETTFASLDGDADGDGVCDNAGYGNANGVSYWTSKLNTGGPAQYVNFGVYGLANNKDKFTTTKCYVRCIRDVATGGAEPPEPPKPEGTKVRVSLVGDSITSYEGTLPAYFEENGAAYYPTGTVTSVTQQYWYKLIYGKMSDAVLEVNNSWRGSTVVWRDHPEYDGRDYCARVERYGLGEPDVVLIHGGTNDCTKYSAQHQTQPNEYRANMFPGDDFKGMAPLALPTDTQFEEVYALAEAADTWDKVRSLEDGYFIPAYVKLLNMIHFKYPKARVVMIIGDGLTKRAQQAILKIADHYGSLYGYKCVNFFGLGDSIGKASGVHPDDAGFTYMAEAIYEQVGSYLEN